MLRVVLQCILTAGAGVLLYLLWRAVRRLDRVAGTIVGLGLLGRLVAGQVLFWISWLDLLPRNFHFGRGIWFFAPDGVYYMEIGTTLARLGPRIMFLHIWSTQTPTYLDLLSLNLYLMGSIPSVALLLNAFFYAGSAWVIARWAADHPRTATASRFAIAAFTFYPAGVLWSLQPLKDSMLFFMLVAFAGAAAWWQQEWAGAARGRSIAGAAATLVVTHFMFSGSRWFLGLVVLGAAAVFFFFVILAARPRRVGAALASLAVLALLCGSFLLGAYRFIPPGLWAFVRPATGSAVGAAAAEVQTVRENFSSTSASTQILVPPGSTAVERCLIGLIATIVPHAVIERFDSVHIGGGRGFFWFADLDTLYLDAVVVIGLAMLWRSRSPALWRDGVFWMLVVSVAVLAPPVFYVTTNFGTLFRFRGVFLVLIALIPLAALSARSRSSAGVR